MRVGIVSPASHAEHVGTAAVKFDGVHSSLYRCAGGCGCGLARGHHSTGIQGGAPLAGVDWRGASESVDDIQQQQHRAKHVDLL